MRKISIFIILISGCITPAKVDEIMESYIGHHFTEVVEAIGPPNHVMEDGSGGQIMTWTENRNLYFPGSSMTTGYGNTSYTTTMPGVMTNYTKYRAFWVDENGIIYKWTWRGL